MHKFLIKEYKGRFFEVAEVFKDGLLISTINKFYEVTPDFIIIYGTVGGSGYGYQKGEVIRKIYIGDAELEREVV